MDPRNQYKLTQREMQPYYRRNLEKTYEIVELTQFTL